MTKLPAILALIGAALASASYLVFATEAQPVKGMNTSRVALEASDASQIAQINVVGPALMVSTGGLSIRHIDKMEPRRAPLGVGRIKGNFRRPLDKTQAQFKETQRALRSVDKRLREIRRNSRRLRDIRRLHRDLP
jgi:hypothetical protein